MAPIVRFRKIQTSDTELQLIQSNLQDAIDSILESPFVGARLITGVVLQSGSQSVGHGLGRNYVSWGWMNPSAAVQLSAGTSPDPSKYIQIVASAPATVDLVVL